MLQNEKEGEEEEEEEGIIYNENSLCSVRNFVSIKRQRTQQPFCEESSFLCVLCASSSLSLSVSTSGSDTQPLCHFEVHQPWSGNHPGIRWDGSNGSSAHFEGLKKKKSGSQADSSFELAN